MSNSPVRKAVIPAAGRGTRFLPLTKSVPKELAPIVTTPAVEFVVAEAASAGIEDVLLVLGEGKEAIAEYFRPAADLEKALEVKNDAAALRTVRRPNELARIHETIQSEPRGLGDAVGHGAQFAAGEPVAVLLPDDLIDDRESLLEPMIRVYEQYGGIVIGLIKVPPETIDKYGCAAPAAGADVDGDVIEVVDLVEKPKPAEAPSALAIIGRYILPPEIFSTIAQTASGALGEIQLTDAMRQLGRQGTPVHGVVFRGHRYDTGNPLDYMKATVQLAVRHPAIGAEFEAWLREYVSQIS